MNHIRNLPPLISPFIGRRDELSELSEMLANPSCRLVTLNGPGGIGKTRLALQVAAELPIEFEHGIAFVPLHLLQAPEQVVHAIADSLQFPLTDQNNPAEALVDHLASRELLLILDNFEHLLAHPSIDLLLQLLHNAPRLKILITSHEALNLQEEWLFQVRGLSLPSGIHPADLAHSGAAQLFTERARQVRRDFSPAGEAAGLARICQLTGGMPLALELAASWAKTLDCAAIAAEIEQNIEFLATRMRDIPQRHRNILAVFQHSWERLSAPEQEAFGKLSVFRGGFQREAAENVAGVSLATLTSLVDKSLLRWESMGRYHMQELVRQFGQEKLHEDPVRERSIQGDFSRYYLDYVWQRTGRLMAGEQRKATLEIERELENIRAAWIWIAGSGIAEGLGQFVLSMSLFFQYQCRYLEGLDMLEIAAERLRSEKPSRQRDLSLASILCDISWLYIRLGALEEAEQNALASYEFVRKHRSPPSEAQGFHPFLPLGIIAAIRGDYAESARLAELVRQESETNPHPWNRQFSYYLLTRASLVRGEIPQAQRYAQITHTLAQSNGDHWFMAYCLNEMGKIALESGDRVAARRYFQDSFELRQGFEDREGMATALLNIAAADMQDGDYGQAGEHFRIAEKIYADIGDKGGLASARYGIGQVAAQQGDLKTARKAFEQALQIAADIQYYSLSTAILLDLSQRLVQTEEPGLGYEILSVIAGHPASERETRERAGGVLAAANLPLTDGAANLESLVARLLARFPDLETASAAGAGAPSKGEQPLIDPLTDRELEVLQHIADGLTNRQIAETLYISTGTAKWYASQIYRKLAVQNRTQAVARARELQLIAGP